MYKVYYQDNTNATGESDTSEPEVILETENLTEALNLACDKFELGEYHSAWVEDQTGRGYPVGLSRQEDGTMIVVRPV